MEAKKKRELPAWMKAKQVVAMLGTKQNLSYDMAGGKGKFFQRNLLVPYEIIAKKAHCTVTLPIKIVFVQYS